MEVKKETIPKTKDSRRQYFGINSQSAVPKWRFRKRLGRGLEGRGKNKHPQEQAVLAYHIRASELDKSSIVSHHHLKADTGLATDLGRMSSTLLGDIISTRPIRRSVCGIPEEDLLGNDLQL